MSVRVSMYKLDHWMAYGFNGLISIISARLAIEIDFHKSIVEMFERGTKTMNILLPSIQSRKVESYPLRDETIDEMDVWATIGLRGITRMLHERVQTLDNRMDSGSLDRIKEARVILDEIIKRAESSPRIPLESLGLTPVADGAGETQS